MLREITLGQYYPADSLIHKMDPRTKLFATVIYIISIFCFRGPTAFVAITGAYCGYILKQGAIFLYG